MILIIDNYDSFTFNLYQIVATLVDEVRVIKNDELTVEEVKNLNPQGIIISPGPGHPDQAGICKQLVNQLAKDVPFLGVCLGHQAIVAALGGSVICAEKVVHGKSSLIFHKGNELFEGLPIPFQAARYHSLVVDMKELPKQLSVLATCTDGYVMAVKHRNFSTYGLQFHPESIMTPQGSDIIRRFINITTTREVRHDQHCA